MRLGTPPGLTDTPLPSQDRDAVEGSLVQQCGSHALPGMKPAGGFDRSREARGRRIAAAGTQDESRCEAREWHHNHSLDGPAIRNANREQFARIDSQKKLFFIMCERFARIA